MSTKTDEQYFLELCYSNMERALSPELDTTTKLNISFVCDCGWPLALIWYLQRFYFSILFEVLGIHTLCRLSPKVIHSFIFANASWKLKKRRKIPIKCNTIFCHISRIIALRFNWITFLSRPKQQQWIHHSARGKFFPAISFIGFSFSIIAFQGDKGRKMVFEKEEKYSLRVKGVLK